jgi:L-ascorbate metabolism protein UlaG (beta-lactamase superfamily)
VWRVLAKRAALYTVAFVAVITGLSVLLWYDRPNLDEIDWPAPTRPAATNADTVTVTWLGVATLLFDDGETQILIDGFFSRPSIADVLLNRNIGNDAAAINFAMNEFRMRRLAAVIPMHSHFDHAMDIGAIANRSSASILGSESSAAIARGAGVPDDQIVVAVEHQPYTFGNFKVTLRPSVHAPIGWRGTVPLNGRIEAPLTMPQTIRAFRVGRTYTIVIEHPDGTVLIQGSAGCIEGELQGVATDVVMLGIGQLTLLSKEYAQECWRNVVTMTGAHAVYPIHFDDYTRAFGDVSPWPKVLGNLVTATNWLQEFRDRNDQDTALFLPRFGEPIALFPQVPEQAR